MTPRGTEARAAPAAGGPAGPGDAGAVVLVADDEAPARDELAYLLQEMPLVSVVYQARSPSEALRSLQARRYDVVFLDVRMPWLNGIDLASVLGRFAVPPAVVFVTAYEEYAIRAFDVGACDYLLKPVSRTRLHTALDRALRHPTGRRETASAGDPPAVITAESAGRVRLIAPGQVGWVESEGDYVRLHLLQGAAVLVRMPISHLEQKWAPHGFLRIHRSYLVPVAHITEFSASDNNHTVKVSGHVLPVSRRHARDVRDRVLRPGRRP